MYVDRKPQNLHTAREPEAGGGAILPQYPLDRKEAFIIFFCIVRTSSDFATPPLASIQSSSTSTSTSISGINHLPQRDQPAGMAAPGEKSDVSLELALVNMEFAVMEDDARCLIQALNSSSGEESYGGTSNSTEAGRMVLQQRLQALTREKAQLRQKKAALEQQQSPSVRNAAAASKGNDGKTVIPCRRDSNTSGSPRRWIVEHHSSATPTAPPGAQNVSVSCVS